VEGSPPPPVRAVSLPMMSVSAAAAASTEKSIEKGVEKGKGRKRVKSLGMSENTNGASFLSDC